MSITELYDRVLFAEHRRDVAEERVKRYELALDAKDVEIERLRGALAAAKPSHLQTVVQLAEMLPADDDPPKEDV